MIRLLTTVDISNLQPPLVVALRIAETVWAKYGADTLWITAGKDGTHKPGSLHYDGKALDLRVKNLPQALWETASNELAAAVGPQFDVLLELAPPHVHVEYDPTHLNR